MRHTTPLRARGLLAALALAFVSLAAAPLADELVVSGTVLYGKASGATRGAEVDIERVYENNPAYLRIEEQGLSKTSGHGKKLFDEARRTTKSALAQIANDYDLHVIAHLGGVSGGEIAIDDHTDEVIELLPMFYIDGEVLHGNKRATTGVTQMDRQAVLDAIPAYNQWKDLDEDDADYYFLQTKYQKQYRDALKAVVLEENANVVVEFGGVTSRGDEIPDLTQTVIDALEY